MDFAVIIHRIVTVGLFLAVFIVNPLLIYQIYTDAHFNIGQEQALRATSFNHVEAELISLNSSYIGINQRLFSLTERTGKLEAKPDLNLSDINAKLNNIQMTQNFLTRSLDANITSLEAQLAVANRQIGILLAQNGSGSPIQQGNASVTTPAYLDRYRNLTCRAELVATFCISDWCKSNLDPEWLCNAGQVMPEYSGWVEQSCACARQAGLPY